MKYYRGLTHQKVTFGFGLRHIRVLHLVLGFHTLDYHTFPCTFPSTEFNMEKYDSQMCLNLRPNVILWYVTPYIATSTNGVFQPMKPNKPGTRMSDLILAIFLQTWSVTCVMKKTYSCIYKTMSVNGMNPSFFNVTLHRPKISITHWIRISDSETLF